MANRLSSSSSGFLNGISESVWNGRGLLNRLQYWSHESQKRVLFFSERQVYMGSDSQNISTGRGRNSIRIQSKQVSISEEETMFDECWIIFSLRLGLYHQRTLEWALTSLCWILITCLAVVRLGQLGNLSTNDDTATCFLEICLL